MSNPESDRQQGENQNTPEGDASENEIISSESSVPEKSEDADDKGTEEASEKRLQLLEELLPDELPDEIKKIILTQDKKARGMALSVESRRYRSASGGLTEKQSSVLNQLLLNDDKQDERAFRDSQISKRYTLAYVCIFCGLFIFITVFLVKNNVSIYLDLIKVAIGFAGGFGSGLGYKSWKDRREKQR